MTLPKRGTVFTHMTKADIDWKPQPGQTWSNDAPKATCRVTRVTQDWVYYGYVGYSGGFKMRPDEWDRDYDPDRRRARIEVAFDLPMGWDPDHTGAVVVGIQQAVKEYYGINADVTIKDKGVWR